MKNKDLLSVADLTPDDLRRILDSATTLKSKEAGPVFKGMTLAMIFEKPSLRTRVSFDVAMYQLGGHSLYLSGDEVGLNKREPVKDTAQVLSRYVNAIVARTFAQSTVEEIAKYSRVPVINGLSDQEHPCQAIADLLTIREKKGRLEGLTLAYVGDGNNVAASLLLACALAGMNFKFASPKGYDLPPQILSAGRGLAASGKSKIIISESPQAAVKGADVVYTDVWTSMGKEAEREKRNKDFAAYQITPGLLSQAKADAILMHPMPVHHGEEFSEGLIDCPQSVLIDQAENRLHAQKAILVDLLKR
ncbi:MAG: ornithine carbamoyltransferase [Dehalococcoidia bacterium]|nr:ornithine carbamoyltransferase [Dehalococcoidia bacterium]